MDYQQAIQILDQAASRALLPREDHYRVQIAVQSLSETFEKMQNEIEKLKKEGNCEQK